MCYWMISCVLTALSWRHCSCLTDCFISTPERPQYCNLRFVILCGIHVLSCEGTVRKHNLFMRRTCGQKQRRWNIRWSIKLRRSVCIIIYLKKFMQRLLRTVFYFCRWNLWESGCSFVDDPCATFHFTSAICSKVQQMNWDRSWGLPFRTCTTPS